MRWKVWYADGTTKEGVRRTTWANAPDAGVVGVATRLGKDEYGRTLGRYAAGGDWYWWSESGIDCGGTGWDAGAWIGFDGPRGTRKDAKKGQWVTDEEYLRVLAEMVGFVG